MPFIFLSLAESTKRPCTPVEAFLIALACIGICYVSAHLVLSNDEI